MIQSVANFDSLAAGYWFLERLAFGRDLERARFSLLPHLASRRSILILGEGDGRCLSRLLEIAPLARIDCIDASAAMLARAERRIARHPGRDRVTLIRADALGHAFAPAAYDALVTLFFLDCFAAAEVATLVGRLRIALQPGARWLFADFALPSNPLARARARIWLSGLYAFFHWQTGLRNRRLPPSEHLIESAGFVRAEQSEFQWGMLRSVLFRDARTTPPTAA